MDGDFTKTIVRVTELTIEDCLGCKNTTIQFSELDSAHLLLYKLAQPNDNVYPITTQTITPVGLALKLLCSMEYATVASLQHLPQLQTGKGCVKMSFKLMRFSAKNAQVDSGEESDLDLEPSTSKQAMIRERLRRERRQQRHTGQNISYVVHVMRRFDDFLTLDRVAVSIDSGNWQHFPITDYYDLFFVQPPHAPEFLNYVNKNCVTDWLNIIQPDGNCYNKLKRDGNPFEIFAKLFDHPNYEQEELLEKLTTSCLTVSENIRLGERRFVLKIFEQVRQIFEFITLNEYTVWFFLPRLNCYTSLDQVTVDDFDLSNVRTSIKLSTDKSPDFWHHADHNIMDILLVAFQMALAKASNQTVLVLGQLDKLAKFITMQYLTSYFMNYFFKDVSVPKWICPRYLHRIIEMSKMLDLVVFIEYPCGITLLPEDRRVIKCYQQQDESIDSCSWQIFMDTTKKAESSSEHLKEILKSIVL